MKIDPYYQRQKCSPMILVSGNIRRMYVDIRRGSPGREASNDSGYFFGNVRDETSNITWRYATPCLPVVDCKMNDLE